MPHRRPPDRQMVVAQNERRVRLPLAPTMHPVVAEQQFADWAQSQGWTVSKRGWPDFICRRGDELMAVEVKAGHDGLRPEQIDAIRDLKRAGFPTFLWTPELGLSEVYGTPLTESVPSLLAEIARLHRIIRGLTESPRPLPIPDEVPVEVVTRVRITHAEELDQLSQWCGAKHRHHDRAGKMPLCAWVTDLRQRLSMADAAEQAGISEAVAEGIGFGVKQYLDGYRHRVTHATLAKAGIRCGECRPYAA